MTKVNIKRLDSVTSNDTTATTLINDNFKALQEAVENSLSRDGKTPNFMDADLDMNSYRIINSGEPTSENDLVTLKYIEEAIGNASADAQSAADSAAKAASSAQNALVSATNASTAVRNAEEIIVQATELLNNTQEYADDAKTEINQVVDNAKSEIDQTLANGKDTINQYVLNAEDEVRQIATDTAQAAVADAAEEATQIALGNLQPLVDSAADSASSAEASKNSAKASETNAKTYENNASSSKNAAASSAISSSNYSNNSKVWAEGSDSQVQALGGVHSAKGWAEEMNINNFVHKTGDETIEGVKTFKNSLGQIYAKSDNVDWTADSISTSSGCGGLYFFDKNQNISGYIQPAFYTNKNRETQLCCASSDGKTAYIAVGFNSSGNAFTKAPTPTTTDNSAQIATTAWVRQVAALKDLSNVSSNIDYIVEQGGNNYKWYRIYKSGRLEQGGFYDNGTSASIIRRQITLLKPYQHQSYNITVTPMSGGCRGTVSGKIVSTTALELQYTGDYGVFDGTDNCRYLSWKTDEAKGN